MNRVCRLSSLLVLFLAGPVWAEPEKKPDPPRYELRKEHDPDGIGKFYLDREIAQVMGYGGIGWLERPEREKEEASSKLHQQLKLKEGMIVADVGAGSGYHTFRMAKAVGDKGKVYAVDVQQEMLDVMNKRIKVDGIKNIETIRGTEKDPKLPEGKVDLILLVDVYHEFAFPYEMTAAMVKSLKPGGRLVFVEFRLEDDKVPIKLVHKMTERQVKKEMEPFPLKWTSTSEVLPWQHIITFEKKKEAKKE